MSKTKEKIISIGDIKQEKATQSAKNRAGGGKDVEVDILSTVEVEFTKDFRKMKKGTKARVSVLAYEFYNKNKVVNKIG